jgi:hypothetical protein
MHLGEKNMSGIKPPELTHRFALLTSMFCLISINQKAQAAPEAIRTLRDEIRTERIQQRMVERVERLESRRELRDIRIERSIDRRAISNESLRNVSHLQNHRAIAKHSQVQSVDRSTTDIKTLLTATTPRLSGTISDTGRTAKQIDLDLTSADSKIILGSKLFGEKDSVTINVGGEQRTFQAGEKVTAGQFVAINQVFESGSQSLILDKNGAAAGGSFSINSVANPKVSDLVIAAGVTGINDFATDRRVVVRGDLTNYGSIIGTTSDERFTSGALFGRNISNETGASIATRSSSAASGASKTASDLSLTLSASERIKNAGSIVSGGNLTLTSDAGLLANSGLIASTGGNISITSGDSTKSIDVQATGGRFDAAGSINIRDDAYRGSAGVNLNGGDYHSQSLNIFSGEGVIEGIVGEVSGQLNTVAGIEHFYASTELLKIGNNCITGDPTFANSAGGIVIQGKNTFGEAVAFLANGDITADGTAQIVAKGYNVYMIAGAALSVSAGPETSTVPGSAIGAGTTATVDFNSGNGGNIDLTGSSVATIIDTSSSTGNAGNVVLAARANGLIGGQIKLSQTSLIDASSTFTDGDGGNVSTFAGANPTAPAITMQLGSIKTDAGPGTGGSGNLSLNTAQPAATGGSTLTFDSLGQIISGGPIVAGTPSVNGKISINNISATGSKGGVVSIIAGSDISTGTITSAGDVAISGTSVTEAAITSAGNITILTSLLHNDGAITSTANAGKILVQSFGALSLEGTGSFGLTGGGAGSIRLDATGANPLALTSSHTFNPGSTGSVTFTSEDDGGSITIAPSTTLTFNDGGTLNIGTPILEFLGTGSSLVAAMASDIKVTSGGGTFPLMIVTPDNGVATISTAGGTIDFTPTLGEDLIFANPVGINESKLNLLGGPVTTNTVSAATFVSSAMHLNSDNSLAMSANGAGGIIGLAFQPYVGGFVNGNQTTQFDGYSLDTVKALLQQLKNDGYTDVATYSQGSFYFGGQFYGPTAATAGSNKFNIQAAAEIGLGVSAGVFQQGVNGDGFNVADTTQELTYILQQAQLFPGTVKEIILCNESIFGAGSLNDLNTLMASAIALRNSTPVTPGSSTMFTSDTLPITTRQRWDVLAGVNNNANPLQSALKTLINTCEGHIYANMYAYFDGSLPDSWSTAPSDQSAFTAAVTGSMSGTLNALSTAFQGQSIATNIRIGETGWPTMGLRAPPLGPAPALGNVTLSNWYFQAMKTWSASNSVPTVIFQAYDQPWQTVPAAQVPTTAGSSEGFFGLYTANGTSTATSFTLTSITNKFAPGNSFSIAAVGTSARMLSNAGTITATNVVINTPKLDNTGLISSISAAGSVSVSSDTDLDLVGGGTISRTGGGTGAINFTTIGANDLEVRGSHTFNAGAGNEVNFNAVADGASFTLAQGAVINLPTNNTKVAINSEHFLRNGTIDTNRTTNPNTIVSVNSKDDTTIASSVGALDISGMDINVAAGHLALLSAGDIINSGDAISIDLNVAGGGGNLVVMAGYNFDDITLGSADPFYVLNATPSLGSVIFNAAGHEVNINTSGTTGGGKVEAYATGPINLNNVTTGGGNSTSGSVTLTGNGVVVGQIDTTASSPADAGAVSIQSGTVVHNGVHVNGGVIESGNFSVNNFGGNISVGDINAAQSSVLIQTNDASISFKSTTPIAHKLSLLAGTGTLNLPTNNLTVLQDSVGNGGSLAVSASTYAGLTGPLVLSASAIGTGHGGSVSFVNTSNSDLVVDQTTMQISADGVNGGSVAVAGGGNVRIDLTGNAIAAGPSGANGNGASFDFSAGNNGSGTLLILGTLDASGVNAGTSGDVKLASNSSETFKISSSRAKNGIQGALSMSGQPGSLTVINAGGGISITQPALNQFANLTLSTLGAKRGNITLTAPPQASSSIDISLGGSGRLLSPVLSATTIALTSGTRLLRAVVDGATTVSVNSGYSAKITNLNSGYFIGKSSAVKSLTFTGNGTLNTLGDIVAGESVYLEADTGDINIGGNIEATSQNRGSVVLEIGGPGNFLDTIAAGTDAIKANTVEFRGTNSSIGSGSLLSGALRVQAANLSILTTDSANVVNTSNNMMELVRASNADDVILHSPGGLTISTGLSSAPNITLDTTGGAGDIVILKSLGSNSSTQTISLATGAGSIIGSGELNAATSVSLVSAGGDIGNAGAPLAIAAPTIAAHTTGSGGVYLSFNGTVPTLVEDSTAGSALSISARGGVTLNDISVSNGAINVTSRKTITILNGSNIEANSDGVAGSGSITLQGTSRSTSSILIDPNSVIATSGVGGGDVSIFIGQNQPQAVNPLAAGANANFFVTVSGGGQVFADLSTITANTPQIALNAIGKDVFINGGSKSAITIGGNVSITADPPLHQVSSTDSGAQTLSVSEAITDAPSPLSHLEKVSSTSIDERPSSNRLSTGSSLLASLTNTIATPVFGQDSSRLTLSATTLTESLKTKTKRQDIPESSQLIDSVEYASGEIDAVHLTQEALISGSPPSDHSENYLANAPLGHDSATRSIERTTLNLKNGSFLCTPNQDTTVKTGLANVRIDKGAMVLLMVRDNSVAIFNLHDSHKNAVTVTAGATVISLTPGRQAVLTSLNADQFHLVNPAEIMQYRSVNRQQLRQGVQLFTSEFSIPAALAAIKPAKQMLASSDKNTKRLVTNVLKTTAILAELDRSNSNPFEQMPHPRLTVYQK